MIMIVIITAIAIIIAITIINRGAQGSTDCIRIRGAWIV
jgi:hypothetical protein